VAGEDLDRNAKTARRVLLAILIAAIAMGAMVCLAPLACFVPIPRTALVRPEGRVRVEDARSHARLGGARVILIRWQLPHRRVNRLWEQTADGSGTTRFSKIEERETIFPLMMHGVPGYEWTLCAEHAGNAPREIEWRPPEDGRERRELLLALESGTGLCRRADEMVTGPPAARDR